MKIGIMGGTFNPIHNGHIVLAKAALVQHNLDEIWFMPSGHPEYKDGKEIISGRHRLAMAALAVKNEEKFTVSDFEVIRSGSTYTADTLMLLKKQYPEDDFYFIIGGDSLYTFERWVRPQDIARNCMLLASARYGYTMDELEAKKKLYEKKYDAKISFVIIPEVRISSSELRKLLREGRYEDAAEFMDKKVLAYIKDEKIYDLRQ